MKREHKWMATMYDVRAVSIYISIASANFWVNALGIVQWVVIGYSRNDQIYKLKFD